jgi:methylenetetrahydrofolate dehydrogenase (NADP+) / methenyltetrahydrofolate cyclohydrolase
MIHLFSKDIVASLKLEITANVDRLIEQGIKPRMMAVVSSADPSVLSYVASKQKAADKLGITIDVCDISSIVEIDRAVAKINDLCADKTIHGILVELPVKQGWDSLTLLNAIDPNKDVDGLCAANLGSLLQGTLDNGFAKPATPEACIIMAQSVSTIVGKNVVIVGRGQTVGKPLANMLINLGATVTVCHSKSVDLPAFTKAADIIFLATGLGHHFGKEYFRDGQIIIDAGISSVNDRIVGDANMEDLNELNISITPVPGGIGPLTSTLIFRNLLNLASKTNG